MKMKTNATLAALLAAMTATAAPFAEPPPYPGMEAWTFREELAKPEALPPVPTNDVRFVRGPVDGHESYRIDVDGNGRVTITTEDDDGLRRAVYYYQRATASRAASSARSSARRSTTTS